MRDRRGAINPVDLACLVLAGSALVGAWQSYHMLRQPVPHAERLEPSLLKQTDAQWLVINGADFTAGCAVIVANHVMERVRFVDSQRMEVYVDVPALALDPGVYDVQVINGWGQGRPVREALEVLPGHPAAMLAPRPATVSSQEIQPVAEPAATIQPMRAEGWMSFAHPALAARVHSGDVLYDDEGRNVGRVVGVAFGDARALPRYVERLIGRHRVTAAAPPEAKQWRALYVTLELLAKCRDGACTYRHVPLQRAAHIPVLTAQYRAEMMLAHPVEAELSPDQGRSSVIEIDVLVDDAQQLQELAPVRSGDAIINIHRETIGRVQGRFGQSLEGDRAQTVVRLSLQAVVKDGLVWVRDTREAEPFVLRRNTRVVLWTPTGGVIDGTVLNPIHVEGLP